MNQNYLKECVSYDRDTGDFVWRDRPRSHFTSDKAYKIFRRLYACKPCGSKSKEGYFVIRIDGQIYKAHRLAWLHETGEWPSEWIDHINRIRFDNRICNLRLATPAINAQNASARRDNKSGVVGVSKHKATGKWVAQITVCGTPKHLGLFDDINSAAMARATALAEVRGVA